MPRRASTALFAAGSLALMACALASATVEAQSASARADTAPNPDPRLSLKAGWLDAGQASWNMRLVAAARPSAPFFNASGATEEIWNSELSLSPMARKSGP